MGLIVGAYAIFIAGRSSPRAWHRARAAGQRREPKRREPPAHTRGDRPERHPRDATTGAPQPGRSPPRGRRAAVRTSRCSRAAHARLARGPVAGVILIRAALVRMPLHAALARGTVACAAGSRVRPARPWWRCAAVVQDAGTPAALVAVAGRVTARVTARVMVRVTARAGHATVAPNPVTYLMPSRMTCLAAPLVTCLVTCLVTSRLRCPVVDAAPGVGTKGR